jgi:hypothetical protein
MPGIEVTASEAGDVAATKRLVENLKATHGRIDVLFVNAGISRFKPSMIDEAFFDTQFGINVCGAYFVMKHAIEIMPDGGSIILTSSVSGALGCCRTDRLWSYESGGSLVRTIVRPGACPPSHSRQHNQSRSDRDTYLRQGRNAARRNGEHSSADRTAR